MQLKSGCLLQALRVLYKGINKMLPLLCACSYIREHFSMRRMLPRFPHVTGPGDTGGSKHVQVKGPVGEVL